MANIRELRAKFTATAKGFKSTVQGIQDSTDDLGKKGSDSADKMNNRFGNLKGTLMKFGGAYLGFQTLKGAVGGVLKVTEEFQGALDTLQTKTGASKEEMQGMETSLKNIYKNNYGDSFTDIAESMSQVKTATGLTGKALEDTTQDALMLRKRLGYDVAESTATASTMMKQFGIDGKQAMTLIAQGSQAGLDKSGDMMDSFNEYSVYFKQLGFDAEGMWNTFKAGAESGSFNMDKVGDAVKEFGIRVKDGSKTTNEAFEGLGMNAGKMSQEFAKGGEHSQKALQKVFKELGKIDDPLKRNAIGVKLFGAQFEDLESETIMALGTVKEQANSTGDTLKKMDAVKYDNMGSALKGMGRTIVVDLLKPIQEKVMPMMNKFVGFVKSNMPMIRSAIKKAFSVAVDIIKGLAPILKNLFTIFKNLAPLIGGALAVAFGVLKFAVMPIVGFLTDIIAKFSQWKGFKPLILGLATAVGTYLTIQKASALQTKIMTGLTKAWAVAQRLLNVAMKMNPIGIIISLIVGLVAVLIYAYKNSETFRNIMKKAWEMLKTVVMAVINWFATNIPIWINNIVKWIKNMGNWISNIFKSLWNGIKAIWNGIVKFITTLITTYINIWKAIFTGLKTAILFIWNALKTGVIKIVQAWWNLVQKLFGVSKKIITSIFTGIKNVALSIWSALKNGVVNTITTMKNIITTIATKIRNMISNIFSRAKSIALGIWNGLKNGVSNIFDSIWSTVTGIMDDVLGFLGDINLFSMGKDMIQGMINGIKNMAGALVSKAKEVIGGAIDGAKALLGINSPSRVFMEFGQFTGEGLAIGIDKMKGMVEKATGSLANASIGTINDAELNPITTDDKPKPGKGGQGGQGGTQYNAPLQHVENQYINDDTDTRSISNGLYGLQRNSDRKKGD